MRTKQKASDQLVKNRILSILLLIMAAAILIAAPIMAKAGVGSENRAGGANITAANKIIAITDDVTDVDYDFTADFDPSFLNVLRDKHPFLFDDNGDIIISAVESFGKDGAVLSVLGKSLTSLRGIKYFTSLRELDCSSNELTELDLTGLSNLQGLNCNVNKLAELDLTSLSNLKWTSCNRNRLKELKVSGLSKLELLGCGANKLTKLDLRGLSNLQSLYCDNNLLTELDVTNLRNLIVLWCYSNRLTELKTAGLSDLQILYCWENQLKELDVSGNAALVGISCKENLLTAFDVSNNKTLENLDCRNNYLPSTSAVQGWQELWLALGSTFLFEPQNLPLDNFANQNLPEADDAQAMADPPQRAGGENDGEIFSEYAQDVLVGRKAIDIAASDTADESAAYTYTVYLTPGQTSLKPGDTLTVDVMLNGSLYYTQVAAEIVYDAGLLEFDSYANLQGWSASVGETAPNLVAVRSVPTINMLTGASCSGGLRIVTLIFTVKGGFAGAGNSAGLSFASALVSPPGGVIGATVAPGNFVSITVQN